MSCDFQSESEGGNLPRQLPSKYEEGYKNCFDIKITELLFEKRHKLKEIACSIRDVCAIPNNLKAYGSTFCNILSWYIRTGKFQEGIPEFSRKFEEMKNKKGDRRALSHLAMGAMRILSEEGSLYIEGPAQNEEVEEEEIRVIVIN